MPDLGVDWPDLNAKDAMEAVTPAPNSKAQTAARPRRGWSDRSRYAWTIEGISGVGNAEELLKSFRRQSALDADRKDPANAAQIGRRSRADADLLVQLLRSQGYYDAASSSRGPNAWTAVFAWCSPPIRVSNIVS